MLESWASTTTAAGKMMFMRSEILLLLITMAMAVPTFASQRVTAIITVTNTPSASDSLTVNGDVRTWESSVSIPADEMLIGASIGEHATNMFNSLASSIPTRLVLLHSGTNGVRLIGQVDQALAASLTGTWGSIALSTNLITTQKAVLVPLSGEPSASVRVELANGLVAGIESYATTEFSDTAAALANYASLDEAQTLENKTLTAPTINTPTITAGIHTGDSFQGRGDGLDSLQLGGGETADSGATASGDYSTALGTLAAASGLRSIAVGRSTLADSVDSLVIGTGSSAEADRAMALGNQSFAQANDSTVIGVGSSTSHTNSVIIGNAVAGSKANEIVLGGSDQDTYIGANLYGTIGTLDGGYLDGVGATNLLGTNNTFAGTSNFSGDVATQQSVNTSLANGANSGIDFGTKSFVKLEPGPTAAFSIDGIANGRDGRRLVIYNATAQPMTIKNESGAEGTPANRILTTSVAGADLVSASNTTVELIYDADSSRWIVQGTLSAAITGFNANQFDVSSGLTFKSGALSTNLQLYGTSEIPDASQLVFGDWGVSSHLQITKSGSEAYLNYIPAAGPVGIFYLYYNSSHRFRLNAGGTQIMNGTGAILGDFDTDNNAKLGYPATSVNQTHGFVYINSVNGVPTGVPALIGDGNNRYPLVWDRLNGDLYGYIGGAWVKFFQSAALTANRAVITDSSGNIISGAITSTEIGFLSGVTGNIQTQLDAKGGGALLVDATGDANVGSAENSIYTNNIPAGVLADSLTSMDFVASGFVADDVQGPQIRIYFGTEIIADWTLPDSEAANGWFFHIQGTAMKRATSGQFHTIASINASKQSGDLTASTNQFNAAAQSLPTGQVPAGVMPFGITGECTTFGGATTIGSYLVRTHIIPAPEP